MIRNIAQKTCLLRFEVIKYHGQIQNLGIFSLVFKKYLFTLINEANKLVILTMLPN